MITFFLYKPPDVPPTGAVVPTTGPVKSKICNLKMVLHYYCKAVKKIYD